MTASLSQMRNKLLAKLPDADLLRLAPKLEEVELRQGQALYESGSTIPYVYFPTGALVSMVYEFEDGASAETAIVGDEGLVGIAAFMGGDSRLGRAVVLRAGHAFRIRGRALKEQFEQTAVLMQLLLHYTQALMTQIAQTAACNRHHSLEQRLCRWLLLSLDRMQDNDVGMTQELIARLLCVRREGVTAAAQHLQMLGLIRCTRGHIAVLDRHGLEQRACECYRVILKEYERLLPRGAEPSESGTAAPRRNVRQPSPAGVFAIEQTDVPGPSSVLQAG